VTVCTGLLGALVIVEEMDFDEAGLGAADFVVDVLVVDVALFTWLLGLVLLKDSWNKQNKDKNKLISFKLFNMYDSYNTMKKCQCQI